MSKEKGLLGNLKTTRKSRNWLVLHAKGLTGRKGAGAHQSKKTYSRKTKHKGKKWY
jgi:hypothetical protein